MGGSGSGRKLREEDISDGKSEITPASIPGVTLKVKVITAGDYMPQARELFGQDKVWENAVALLYSENKVIAILDRKGEAKFIVEA